MPSKGVLALERKYLALVLEQDDPLCCRFANEGTMFWCVQGLLWPRRWALEETSFVQ